jgi:regulatory protein
LTAIISEEERKAKEYALSLLSYRQRSYKELADRLRAKGHKDAAINTALSSLKELNLINDEAFARSLAERRISRNPVGKKLLSQELQQKGIAAEIIVRVCEDVFAERSEESLALTLANNKLRSSQNLDPKTRTRRLYSYLIRRGFPADVIQTVMEKVSNEC